MDQFNQTSANIDLDDNLIVIYGEKRKKTNTYIIGLPLDELMLKTHLKTMKNQFGCGGSIKEVELDGKNVKALHLQGDKIEKATRYIEQFNYGKIESRYII